MSLLPSDIAISVENLGKEYVIGGHRGKPETFREMLSRQLMAPYQKWLHLRGKVSEDLRFWALKDLSFEVKHGEVLGIIGRNGAGKSTLLKVLSRITAPTEGRVLIRGKVGSLLEVGTGFHHELTGRENIFLNGAILGMKRKEIMAQFDEIVAFAEVEKFIDTPVKHYSSGMYIRLAFAVAAHLRTEILLVDEVLAVGDSEFQKRCLGKMSEVAQGGRTVLFVSHNMAAVQNLCSRVLVLSNGQLQQDASSQHAIEAYLDTIETSAGGHLGDLDREFGYIPILQNLVCLDGEGERIGSVAAGSPLRLEITYKHEGPLKDPFFGITFENAAGVRIFSAQTQQNHGPLPDHNAEGVITCELPRLPLAPGIYFISLGIGSRGVLLDAVERAIRLEVIESDVFGTGFLLPTRHSLVLVDSLWRVDEKAIHVSSGAPSGLS